MNEGTEIIAQVDNAKVRAWLLEHPERLNSIIEAEYRRVHGVPAGHPIPVQESHPAK